MNQWSPHKSKALSGRLIRSKRQTKMLINIWQVKIVSMHLILRVWKRGVLNRLIIKMWTSNNTVLWTGKNFNHWVCRLGSTIHNSKAVRIKQCQYLARSINSLEFLKRMTFSRWVTFKNWLRLKEMKTLTLTKKSSIVGKATVLGTCWLWNRS